MTPTTTTNQPRPATVGDALLADVCRYPSEVGYRLLFADWCEEHGQAERAEFIRLQCRTDRAPLRDENRDMSHREWVDALKRACDLWHDGRAYWSAGLPSALGDATNEFDRWRRGFVEVAVLPLREWLAKWRELRAAAPLRVVRLTGGPPTHTEYCQHEVEGWEYCAGLAPLLRRLCVPFSDGEDPVAGLDTLDLTAIEGLTRHQLHDTMRDSFRPWKGLRRLVLPNWSELENRYFGHEAEQWAKWVPGLRVVEFGPHVVRLDGRGGAVEEAAR